MSQPQVNGRAFFRAPVLHGSDARMTPGVRPLTWVVRGDDTGDGVPLLNVSVRMARTAWYAADSSRDLMRMSECMDSALSGSSTGDPVPHVPYSNRWAIKVGYYSLEWKPLMQQLMSMNRTEFYEPALGGIGDVAARLAGIISPGAGESEKSALLAMSVMRSMEMYYDFTGGPYQKCLVDSSALNVHMNCIADAIEAGSDIVYLYSVHVHMPTWWLNGLPPHLLRQFDVDDVDSDRCVRFEPGDTDWAI